MKLQTNFQSSIVLIVLAILVSTIQEKLVLFAEATTVTRFDSADCTDRTDQWTIGTRTRNWCRWTIKEGEENIARRCESKNLYNDCPVICNSCPSPNPTPSTCSCCNVQTDIAELKIDMISMQNDLKETLEIVKHLAHHIVPSSAPSLVPSEKPSVIPSPVPTLQPTITSSLSSGGPNACVSEPCGRCAGNCNSDLECLGSMICYHDRDNFFWNTNGCSGTPATNGDYCAEPGLLSFPLKWDGEQDSCADTPCEVCVGDCDDDSECTGDLVCYHDKDASFWNLYGCTGTPAPIDYCAEPGLGSSLVWRGWWACPQDSPCGMCVGDCDNDSECAGDLVCISDKDDAFWNDIVGCTGTVFNVGSADYCGPSSAS